MNHYFDPKVIPSVAYTDPEVAWVGLTEDEAKAKGMTRDQVYEGYAKGTSMQSFVEAQDIANMALFLASDAARFVSGQMIAVDGHTVNPDPQV